MTGSDVMALSASYQAGSWVAVSGPGRWLLLDLAPQHELVRRCWDVVSAAGSVDDLIDVLISSGIRAVPDFALVWRTEAEQRVVVRGGAVVEAGASDPRVIVANGQPIWIEPIDGAELFVLRGTAIVEPGIELPMAAGVTLASQISVRESAQTPASAVRPSLVKRAESVIVVDPAPAPVDDVVESPPTPADDAVTLAPAQPVEPVEPVVESLAEANPYDHLFGATHRPAVIAEMFGGAPGSVEQPSDEPEGGVLSESSAWNTRSPYLDVDERPDAASESVRLSQPVPSQPLMVNGIIDGVPGMSPIVDPAAPSPTLGIVDSAPENVQRTNSRANLAALVQAASTSPADGPPIAAVRCPVGHANDPKADLCRVCRAVVPVQAAVKIARPPLGLLRLSTGETVTLDRAVLIGRAPAERDIGGQRPHIIRVSSGSADISRDHVVFILDAWHVMVEDLGSTNGTELRLPGREPIRLRERDKQLLESGAIITLADEIHCVFEVSE